jgi:PEP-CTERM motif-containing protein
MKRVTLVVLLGTWLLCPSSARAVPITVTINQNTPTDFAMTVSSGGPFGGQRTASNGVGNWIFDFTVNERAQVRPPSNIPLLRDILEVNGNVQHNVRPPGSDHTDDATKGNPLAFGFTVDATTPGNPAPLLIGASLFPLSGQAPHPGGTHFDTFAIVSLPVVTKPTNAIDTWNFRLEAHHMVPEPSTWLLLGIGLTAFQLWRWCRTDCRGSRLL